VDVIRPDLTSPICFRGDRALVLERLNMRCSKEIHAFEMNKPCGSTPASYLEELKKGQIRY